MRYVRTISIRPGTYAPDGFRDIPYKELTIRGYVVVENKDLSLVGEAGTVLDGTNGQPASAVVVNGGQLTVKNLTLRNFRAASPQDNIYDGHGLFFIDAGATVSNVTIESIDKMALTERGNSTVDAANIRILDGQVGIWLEESSHLRLRNSVIRDNQSAGICAYSNSSANIYNSVFDGTQDDGIYSEGEAAIYDQSFRALDEQARVSRLRLLEHQDPAWTAIGELLASSDERIRARIALWVADRGIAEAHLQDREPAPTVLQLHLESMEQVLLAELMDSDDAEGETDG